MITDNQISALAREYAEETCAHMEDDFIKDEAIRDNELAFQMAVEHLSRRYCLVEKSRIQEEYQKAQTQIKDGRELGVHVLVTFGGAKEALLESLFPDLGKEVES